MAEGRRETGGGGKGWAEKAPPDVQRHNSGQPRLPPPSDWAAGRPEIFRADNRTIRQKERPSWAESNRIRRRQRLALHRERRDKGDRSARPSPVFAILPCDSGTRPATKQTKELNFLPCMASILKCILKSRARALLKQNSLA